mmetsp:Transcript_2276/g.4209  ORF Transcript_2276/g.4209 Transcript_2276/m.4209 type:complete len:302 (-) Transcript_2276:1260-2165(-)
MFCLDEEHVCMLGRRQRAYTRLETVLLTVVPRATAVQTRLEVRNAAASKVHCWGHATTFGPNTCVGFAYLLISSSTGVGATTTAITRRSSRGRCGFAAAAIYRITSLSLASRQCTPGRTSAGSIIHCRTGLRGCSRWWIRRWSGSRSIRRWSGSRSSRGCTSRWIRRRWISGWSCGWSCGWIRWWISGWIRGWIRWFGCAAIRNYDIGVARTDSQVNRLGRNNQIFSRTAKVDDGIGLSLNQMRLEKTLRIPFPVVSSLNNSHLIISFIILCIGTSRTVETNKVSTGWWICITYLESQRDG